jgi:UDP-N-acetylmuramyl pentapeptide synthase
MKEASVMSFREAQEAIEPVVHVVKPGDTILIKGSQGTRMEQVVKRLLLHPEEAKTLLARQDEEWGKR